MKIENPASVWRLKVELLGVAPTVWRRLDTYADVKLSQLHYFIQGAMGWELAHLFSYQIPSWTGLCKPKIGVEWLPRFKHTEGHM